MPRKRNLTADELAAWFWSKTQMSVDHPGCVAWTAGLNEDGYGLVHWGGRTQKAHRIAWELTNGPVPRGMCVLHHCDHPWCVNVDRCLWLGTDADNAADREAKGRGNHPSGEAHGSRTKPERLARGDANGSARLDDGRVRAILARASAGESQRALARTFGVSQSTIRDIVRRHIWRHIT